MTRILHRHRTDEATIPCATTRTPQASHLGDDRRREPTFADLIAGNKREPSHADLLVDDEDDQDLKPAARELPIVYPGVSVGTLAWLREQDNAEQPIAAPAVHDEHAFDVDHLVPAGGLRIVDPNQLDTRKLPSTMPAGNPQLLFDALDALDRLPALYAVDAASFEMAASIAAIQTYTALRPDLIHTSAALMTLVPLAAQLKLADAEAAQSEPTNHTGQLAAAWTSIREAHTRFATAGFVPVDHRFYTAIELDALDGLIEDLSDEICLALGVFDAEAADIELLAIEAGLPMLADWERELLALPESEPDPGAERAFADMNATADAEDALYDEIEAQLNDGLEEWLAAEDGDESHFTRAQMDGEACTVCGGEFTVGQPTVPTAYDLVEGQLFAHAACAESEA